MIQNVTRDKLYPEGKPVDLEEEFGVEKIGPNLYRGKKTNSKTR